MSEITKIDLTTYTDHIPQQFNDSPLLHKLLGVFLKQVQELEDANIELDRVSTGLYDATGYQLDIIGKLIGRSRQSQADTQYRYSILTQISLNIGNGTPEDVIQYLSSVTRSTKTGYWEHYPASVIMESDGNIPPDIANAVDNVTMAGVSVGGIIDTSGGICFRGVSLEQTYSNYELAYFVDAGGNHIVCGGTPAECVSAEGTLFYGIEDASGLARCILPSEGDTDDKGKFASVYTKI